MDTIETERRLLIQYPDGSFLQVNHGLGGLILKTNNPFHAIERTDLMFLSDALSPMGKNSGGRIVEIEVTARLTGRTQDDLYRDGKLMEEIDHG